MATNIKSISSPLPECTPNLMPFHIEHNGAAPISTYFHVNPTKERVGAPPAASDASNETDVAHELSINDSENSNHQRTRFISSFRGRTIQGMKTELPKGYTGLLLNIDDDVLERSNGHAESDNMSGSQRIIAPIAQFSALNIWNPDIPLDEGSDQYCRVISEWTALAEIIHDNDVD